VTLAPPIGLLPAAPDAIPEPFRDLVDAPRVVALTTLMPDGRPQTSVVWCDADRSHIRINCMRHFRKTENMRRDPRVALLCFDPRRPLRYLAIRGRVASLTEDGALDHLDALTSRYLGRPAHSFGDGVAAELAATETPVLCRIVPTKAVGLDAEHEPTDGCPPRRESGDSDGASPAAVTTGAPGGGVRGATASGPAARSSGTAGSTVIPASHLDLIGAPNHGVLTTLMSDGNPRSSLVWLDHDGGCAKLNTTLERHKGRDLMVDPAVSLLVVDAEDTSRYIQIRGDAELILDGAVDHLDELTRRYTRHPAYYGHVHPLAQRERETRVIVRIHATRITLDAIHR
jgi:PPOX class probable F420-dependent enzyme